MSSPSYTFDAPHYPIHTFPRFLSQNIMQHLSTTGPIVPSIETPQLALRAQELSPILRKA